MTYLNKRRSADENIGKLIMFSVTIIIAVGLVGLITFFYNQSRVQSVNMSILASTASSATDIANIEDSNGNTIADATTTDGCNAAVITYNPVTNLYSLKTTANATPDAECDAFFDEVKGITYTATTDATNPATYTIN